MIATKYVSKRRHARKLFLSQAKLRVVPAVCPCPEQAGLFGLTHPEPPLKTCIHTRTHAHTHFCIMLSPCSRRNAVCVACFLSRRVQPIPRHAQSRPNIFDLEIRRPELLYKAVVEVDERVVLDKGGEGGWEEADGASGADSDGAVVVQGVTGEGVRVVKEPDLAAVRASLQGVLDQGITSLAVVFLHR